MNTFTSKLALVGCFSDAGSLSSEPQITSLRRGGGSSYLPHPGIDHDERITMGTTAMEVPNTGLRLRRDQQQTSRPGVWTSWVCGLIVLLWAGTASTANAQIPNLPPAKKAPELPGGPEQITPPPRTITTNNPGQRAPQRSVGRTVGKNLFQNPSKATPVPQPTTPGEPNLDAPPELPLPRAFGGPGLYCGPEGCMPSENKKVDEKTLKRYHKFIKEFIDTEVNLDLEVGKTRLMVLKQAPKRIQVADDTIAGYTVITPKEISLLGKQVGSTVLTLWFQDPNDPTKQEILSYHVRVYPDKEARRRLERVYEALAKEINCHFPNSNVCLKLIGDKIVVTGHAHDVQEASQILTIIRIQAPNPRTGRPAASEIPTDRIQSGLQPGEKTVNNDVPPGLEDYELAGGPFVINLLKVHGEQQVMLRVTVAEVNRAAARSVGMNFSLLNNDGIAYFANNTGAIGTGGAVSSAGVNGRNSGALGLINFAAANTFGIPPLAGFPAGAGGFNNLPVALDNGQVRLAISALRTLNYARSLAEPNLVALNGQTASFRAGGEFPVPIVTGFTAAGLQGVNFVPFGVQLNFTPFITDRDRIRLIINAEVSTRDISAGTANIGGTAVPNLTSRNFQTTVELREGQTLAVAGLIQNNLGADTNRIPFLGDLPILSTLTGFTRTTAGEQELVVLVTPELVHPMEPKDIPPLPGSDIFEPNDLEFYLLGRIESHYPIDYRSTIRTDFQRIRQYRMMESQYLYGDHGPVPPH